MITRAVAKHLAAEGTDLTYAQGSSSGNVFRNRFPSIAERSLAVMGTGGLPEPTKSPIDRPTIQVLVRGDVDDLDSAEELAYWVIGELTCLDGVWLDQDGADEVWLIGCTAIQTDPIPLGLDDVTRCYEFSTNFQLIIHNPTTHRPGA